MPVMVLHQLKVKQAAPLATPQPLIPLHVLSIRMSAVMQLTGCGQESSC